MTRVFLQENSKHEIRISKQPQMTKIRNQENTFLSLSFEHSDLEFVSDFDIRISDFY